MSVRHHIISSDLCVQKVQNNLQSRCTGFSTLVGEFTLSGSVSHTPPLFVSSSVSWQILSVRARALPADGRLKVHSARCCQVCPLQQRTVELFETRLLQGDPVPQFPEREQQSTAEQVLDVLVSKYDKVLPFLQERFACCGCHRSRSTGFSSGCSCRSRRMQRPCRVSMSGRRDGHFFVKAIVVHTNFSRRPRRHRKLGMQVCCSVASTTMTLHREAQEEDLFLGGRMSC